MKHLKKVNEFFGDYDHFDEISPEQAYQEVEQAMGLPSKENIKDEIESAFEFIEGDGLNPYEMTFDEFYNWTLSNFRLEHPKSFYENEFKSIVHNPNQLELPFEESMKHLITFNETSNKKIMDTLGSNLLKHKEYAKKNKVSVNVNRTETLTKELANRIFSKYNDPNFYIDDRFSKKELDGLLNNSHEENYTKREISKIKEVIHPLLHRGINFEHNLNYNCISLYLYKNITINKDFDKRYDDDDNLFPYEHDKEDYLNKVSSYIRKNERNQLVFNLSIFKYYGYKYEIVAYENDDDDAPHYFFIKGIDNLIQFLDDLLNKN